jgi:glycosyltransferase involved in cell wall biosynthesis
MTGTGVTRPTVTVVIPTRNRAHLLEQTLASVLAQQAVSLEVVVVDEASDDDTPNLIAAVGGSRIRTIRHEVPRGVSAARNAGIAAARGEWLAFLDDDDLWAPDKLCVQLEAARAQGRTWAVTGAVSVDNDLRVLAGERPLRADRMMEDLRRYNSIPVGASNVVVRRDVLASVGEFSTQLRHMADWELWLRLAETGKPAVVPRPLVAYRLHAASATLDTAIDAAEPLAELEFITTRHDIPADRAAVYRWVAWSSLRAGRRMAAVSAYWLAIREGDLKSAARMVVAVAHPQIGRRTFYRPFVFTRQDRAWFDEAGAWLRGVPLS